MPLLPFLLLGGGRVGGARGQDRRDSLEREKKWQEETHPYLSTKPSLHIIASKRDYTDP